jgi:hypothetical protein
MKNKPETLGHHAPLKATPVAKKEAPLQPTQPRQIGNLFGS